jgi:hypothetical protein
VTGKTYSTDTPRCLDNQASYQQIELGFGSSGIESPLHQIHTIFYPFHHTPSGRKWEPNSLSHSSSLQATHRSPASYNKITKLQNTANAAGLASSAFIITVLGDMQRNLLNRIRPKKTKHFDYRSQSAIPTKDNINVLYITSNIKQTSNKHQTSTWDEVGDLEC